MAKPGNKLRHDNPPFRNLFYSINKDISLVADVLHTAKSSYSSSPVMLGRLKFIAEGCARIAFIFGNERAVSAHNTGFFLQRISKNEDLIFVGGVRPYLRCDNLQKIDCLGKFTTLQRF